MLSKVIIMRSMAIAITLLIAIYLLAGSSPVYGGEIKVVGTVKHIDVLDIVTEQIDTIRATSRQDKSVSVLPAYYDNSLLKHVIYPMENDTIAVTLDKQMAMSQIGSGCVDSKLHELQLVEFGFNKKHVHVHKINITKESQDTTEVAGFAGDVEWAGYDCKALITVEREGITTFLRQYKYDAGDKVGDPDWTVDLTELDAGYTPGDRVYLDKQVINVHLNRGNRDKELFLSFGYDGKLRKKTLVKKLFDKDGLAIVGAAYGYVGIDRGHMLSRKTTYHVLDDLLNPVHKITHIGRGNSPIRDQSGRYLFVEPEQGYTVGGKDKRRSLVVTAYDESGDAVRYEGLEGSSSAINQVRFGSAVAGTVAGRIVVLSSGSTLIKIKKGFLIKDGVYYFSLSVD